MADGYTISEAAELLGIPQRKVTQLIERGVLQGGLDDRRRWRVYLSAPASVTAVRPPEPTTANGHTARPAEPPAGDAAASQFRDLLAELRHLQERYGQALLALGEARGETAALRGRVEQLERRTDLHLPPAVERDASPAATRFDAGVATPPRPVTPLEAARDMPSRPPVRRRVPRPVETDTRTSDPTGSAPRAPRFGASALSGALARAEDPRPVELPGARAAAEALAEFRRISAITPNQPARRDAIAIEPAEQVPATEPVERAPIPEREPVGRQPVPGAEPAPGPLNRLRRWLSG